MDMKYLLLSVEDKVATVTIHRPDKGNALAPEVLMEVEAIFTDLSKRQDVNVIVFTGGERFFSAGFDLNIIRKLEKVSNEEYTALFHRAYRAILFCDQPVICAVGGPAIAGGFDLTLMCDIRYASERAKFGQREIVLSLTPIMDPLWRIIGMGNAKEVGPHGPDLRRPGSPAHGLRHESLPRGQAVSNQSWPLQKKWPATIACCLKETKQLANTCSMKILDGAMKVQGWLFRTFIGSEDNHQRIDALQAKLAAARKNK